MTALIDYGIGNLRSLEKAFQAAGAPVVRTADPDVLAAAERLVLPGVGAFGACADALRARGLDALVRARVAAGVPLLGVCVGMQLLFETGEEMGTHEGLGLLPGRVVRFDGPAFAPGPDRLKVPHMGWNTLAPTAEGAGHPLLAGLGDRPHVYFVHSYHAAPADARDVLATARYGLDVPAVVGRGHVLGVQFHPEKSHAAGLRLLRAFAAWPAAPAGQPHAGPVSSPAPASAC